MSDKCEICTKPATKRCANCRHAFYCDKEHQKDAWKVHKKSCHPFILRNDVNGQIPIATRPIARGSLIIKESPLVYGPRPTTIPVCLGCCKAVTANNRPCTKCGWPMCSILCEKSPAHIPECRYTIKRGERVYIKNYGVIHPSYQGITTLRCLYRKEYLEKIWSKFGDLPAEATKIDNIIADFIRRFYKLDLAFEDSDLARITAILSTYGETMTTTTPSAVALYEHVMLFPHDCSANCTKTFNERGKIIILAGKNIEEGEILTLNRVDSLEPIWNRQRLLAELRRTQCTCARCTDPTEFGSHFSSLRCQNGCDNFIYPSGNHWKCTGCPKEMPTELIQEVQEHIESDWKYCRKTVQACQSFMEKWQDYLHPQSYYTLKVQMALLEILKDCTKENELSAKLEMCRNLRKLLEKIVPGELFLLDKIQGEIDLTVRKLTDARRKNGVISQQMAIQD